MSIVLSHGRRSNGLQALRGVAALLVLFQHFFWLAEYFSPGPTKFIISLMMGGTGVFLFFALSGFLMISQIDRPAKRFLKDRFRRIYPGLGLAVLVSGSTLACFSYNGWPKLTTLLLLPVGVADNIYIPYWTLIYELQFYLIVILVGRLPYIARLPVFTLWAAAILISNFGSMKPAAQAAYPSATEIVFSFYNLYFIVGMLAWWFLKKMPPSIFEGVFALVLTLALALSNAFMEVSLKFYHYGMLLVVFCAVRYLAVVKFNGGMWRALRRFGDVSYGVYLIHITTGFLVVLVVKETLRIQLGYWHGALVILIFGGGLAYLFGWVELKLQEALKQRKAIEKPDSPSPCTSVSSKT